MRKAMLSGSSSHESYAENSSTQNYNFHALAKPRLQQAIHSLFSSVAPPANCSDAATAAASASRQRIAIADFGCSYGSNTLDCMHSVLSTVLEICSSAADLQTEIHYFFCDLPSNDFNSLFESLHRSLLTTIADQRGFPLPNIFTAGVPGSFYGRLFPSASLQLGICIYSLHWLSKIPPSLTDNTSPAWNGGRTWMHRKTSPARVVDAYAEQSQIDLKDFLKSRSHELVSGGVLFLFSPTLSEKKKQNTAPDTFDLAWKELVAEGIITMEEMDMFNLPLYLFNQEELQCALKDVPELEVLHMETIRDVPMFQGVGDESQMQVEKWLGMATSISKPTVEDHLGKPKSDALFKRFKVVLWRELEYFSSCLTEDLVITTLLRL